MFSKLINSTDIKSIVDVFKNVSVSEYWTTHYTPKNKSTSRSKRIGESSIFSLIINVIVPINAIIEDLIFIIITPLSFLLTI